MSLEFLEETLKATSVELMSRFGGRQKFRMKADLSFVTDSDLASEKIIIDRIHRYFPGDVIYSEEAGRSTTERVAGTHVWVIDPLDGTTNFANGYPFFCVSIGRGVFGKDGKITMNLGGIADPTKQKIYLAEKGRGATVNGKVMATSHVTDFAKAFMVTGFYYSMGDRLKGELEKFERAAEKCQAIRRDGAAALDMALVAEGVFDAFWERGLQPWDVAAGSLLILEAGGKCVNYNKSLDSVHDIEGDGVITGGSNVVAILHDLFE